MAIPIVMSCTSTYAHNDSYFNWNRINRLFSDDDESHFDKYKYKRERVDNSQLRNMNLMTWPSLTNGLNLRYKDEIALKKFIVELQSTKGNITTQSNKDKLATLIYGPGLSAHDRNCYLTKYGCTALTEKFISVIMNALTSSPLSETTTKKRGIVEIGAGNGQWARHLHDNHSIDIVAFDSMKNLPLTNIEYHKFSNPRNEIPHDNADNDVRSKSSELNDLNNTENERPKTPLEILQGDHNIFLNQQLITKYSLAGRALLIVYPDPTDMALNCIQKYTHQSKENNLLIYVGEGRGGCNANEAFFDELENNNRWILLDSCPQEKPFGGRSKGLERLFIFYYQNPLVSK